MKYKNGSIFLAPVFVFIGFVLFSCDSNGMSAYVSRPEPFSGKVSVVSVSGGKALSLTWKIDEGADSYIIMRSENGQSGLGEFTEIYNGIGTAYIDKTVDVCISYTYRLDKLRGGKVFKGKELTHFLRILPFFDTINAEGLEGGSIVRLSWSKDENTDGYILRKQSIDQDNNCVNLDSVELEQTTYIDTELELDKLYIYRLDKMRGGKLFEGIAVTMYSRMRPPPVPGVLEVTSLNEGKTVHLSWKADAGADSYIVMKTEAGAAGIDFTDAEKTRKFEFTDKISYVDNDIDTVKSYAYRLDKMRRGKLFEGTAVTMYSRMRPPPVPGVLEVTSLNEGKTVHLSWKADAGADSYIVMKTEAGAAGIDFTDAVKTREFEFTDKTSYVDNDIDIDKSYAYRLDKKQAGRIYEGKEIYIFDKSRMEPFPCALTVMRLNEGKTASISWKADAGADSYIVMKTEAGAAGIDFTDAVKTWEFEFTDKTSYVDNDIDTTKSYAYRLDKKQAGRMYEGTDVFVFDRSRMEPFPGVLSVVRVNEGKTAYINWGADAGADSYIVMKTEAGAAGIDFTDAKKTQKFEFTDKISYVDNDIDIDKSYAYRLDKKQAGRIYEGTDVFVFDKIRMEPFPGVLTVMRLNEGKTAYISWEADSGADSYIVMKTEAGAAGIDFTDAEKTQKFEFTDKTSYVDNNIDTTKSYAYRLDKKQADHIYEGIDVFVFDRSRMEPFPGVLTVVSVNEGKTAYINWEADSGADSYIVMKTEAGAAGINFADAEKTQKFEFTDKTSYVDNDIDIAKSYAYRLDKKQAGRMYEGTDVFVFDRSRMEPFPGALTVVRVNEGNIAYISWEADSGADSYIVMKTEAGAAGIDFTDAKKTQKFEFTDKTSYVDNDIDIGKSYAYRLDKKQAGRIYEGSDVYIFNKIRVEPFPGVLTVMRLNEGKTAYISWEADSGADSYIVMKTEAGAAGIDFADAGKTRKFEFTDKTSYVDNDIDIGKSYAYRLDKKQAARVYEGNDVFVFDRSRIDPFPGIVVAQSLNGGKTAYLTWQADKGADAYRIMRSVNDGSSVVFVERKNGVNGFYMQGETSAMDSALADDKSYLYRLDKERDGQWFIGKEITVFSQNRAFPFAEAPKADGFRWDGKIVLSWGSDDGADTYVLMRRYDNPILAGFGTWSMIWEGSELNYVDNAVNAAQLGRYEYRLDKRRNGTIYKWENKTTLAVAAGTEKDIHEPNDAREQASLLDNYREGNIYCFGYYDGRVIADTDWYKVSIPAGKTANITISYSDTSNDGWFQLYISGQPTKKIIHNNSFAIKNDDNAQQYVVFAIQPRREEFLINGLNGGSVVSYTINWNSISNN